MANRRAVKAETPTRAQEIDGPRDHPTDEPRRYRIQRMLPLGHPYLGMTFHAAEFRRYPNEPDRWYVEVQATIGAITPPYTLVLTVPQALEADIVERD